MPIKGGLGIDCDSLVSGREKRPALDDGRGGERGGEAFSKKGLQEAKAGNAGGEVTPPQSG